jgi:L-rhamnose isomerase
MKNYLVTLIGNFITDDSCNEMVMSVAPLVDSPNMKYQFGGGILMMHFATEVPKDEIFEYISNLIHVDSEILILTEVSDKVSVHIPYEKSGHLFDLDNPGQNNDYSIDMKGVIENTDLYNDYDEDDDIDISFSNELESQFKSKIQHWMGTPAVKTTLDTILDKINILGMDSLTKHELTLLQNYSNN